MSAVVLDASAFLALARREPGAEQVAAVLGQASMSAVNYAEVLKKTIERQGDEKEIEAFLRTGGLEIVPFDSKQALAAAQLYLPLKEHGMSFGDRACLALALLRKADVYTAEREMDKLGLPVRVRLIRHCCK